jgi:signal transduction histidine kinase
MIGPPRDLLTAPTICMSRSPSSATRVFIVDDDRLIRRSYERLLQQRRGLSVVGSSDTASEALARLSAVRMAAGAVGATDLSTGGGMAPAAGPPVASPGPMPDVVLVDVSLPDADGPTLVRAIRDQELDVGCLIVSGHGGTDRVQEGLDAGADGFQLKGSTESLPTAIDAVAAGKRYVDPSVRDSFDASFEGAAGSVARRDDSRRDARDAGAQNRLRGIAHDMRSALARLDELAGAMDGDGQPPGSDSSPLGRRVADATRRLRGLVGCLEEVAETGGARPRLSLEPVRLRPVLEAVRRDYAEQAGTSDLALDLTVREAGLTASADRDGLRRILDNLVSNAVRHAGAGARIALTADRLAPARVLHRLKRADACAGVAESPEWNELPGGTDFVVASVADTGAGMEPDFAKKAFTARTRADDAGLGQGMGLAVVDRLARAMHGAVALASAQGEGTRIDVFLPEA